MITIIDIADLIIIVFIHLITIMTNKHTFIRSQSNTDHNHAYKVFMIMVTILPNSTPNPKFQITNPNTSFGGLYYHNKPPTPPQPLAQPPTSFWNFGFRFWILDSGYGIQA